MINQLDMRNSDRRREAPQLNLTSVTPTEGAKRRRKE